MLDVVKNVNGKAVTTSRKIAEVFEKQHKDVLRVIRELEIPAGYRERNFAPAVYEQPNPSGGKAICRPEYLVTKDGFVLLAMGFTGKRAMEFKIAYINAFNAMEEQIKNALPAPAPAPNIAESTALLIDKINRQLIVGVEIDKEVLRYAWNIGRMFDRQIKRATHVDCGVEAFILSLPCGEYSRGEVYEQYCAGCAAPISSRRFWPAVRAIRPLTEKRGAYCRRVIFK